MNWSIWIVAAVVIAVFIILKRLNLISPEAARDRLKQGARVIDVRSEAEFHESRISGAINIPLNRLGAEIARHVPHKEHPILLHCLSGGRSGIGKSVLNRMGYRNCFNLGSFERAKTIVESVRRGSA